MTSLHLFINRNQHKFTLFFIGIFIVVGLVANLSETVYASGASPNDLNLQEPVSIFMDITTFQRYELQYNEKFNGLVGINTLEKITVNNLIAANIAQPQNLDLLKETLVTNLQDNSVKNTLNQYFNEHSSYGWEKKYIEVRLESLKGSNPVTYILGNITKDV